LRKTKIKTKTLTIKKVRLSGKWMEFWFYEPDFKSTIDPDGSFELCCKTGTILSLLDEQDENELYNNGLAGRQLIWKYDKPNWEVVAFPHHDNYNTWIGKHISKRSNKPFKCGYKETTVLGLVYNTQSEKIGFQLSNSIVDCVMCKLVEEN